MTDIITLELGTKKFIQEDDEFIEKVINKYKVPLVLNAGGLQKASDLHVIDNASMRDIYGGDFGDSNFCTKVLYIGYLGGQPKEPLTLQEFADSLVEDIFDINMIAHDLVFPELKDEYRQALKELREKNEEITKEILNNSKDEREREDIKKK